MESQRNLLMIALLFLSFMIWQTWQTEHSIQSNANGNEKNQKITTESHLSNTNIQTNIPSHIVTIKTDVLLLEINTQGGNIEQAFLLSYPEELNSKKPFHLLETSSDFVYQVQSGLTSQNDGPDSPFNENRPLFTTNQDTYVLSDDTDELSVPFTYIDTKGILYTKTFILKRNSFTLDVIYNIANNSDHQIEMMLFSQLKQSINLPNSRNNSDISNNFALHTYRGAAYSNNNNKYQKYSFNDIKNNNLSDIATGGWVAMLQKYFVAAWIPHGSEKNEFYTKLLDKELAVIGFKSTPLIIPAGNQGNLKAKLWIGPEIQDQMETTAPYLDLVVDYGWLWFISQPLFKLLKFINSYIGNWGASIVIITFIVRVIMYPLTKAQYTSMAKIRMLQPKLIAIRERAGDDKKRQNQEIMALYKKEKVNPLGGCLPILIQMPIFLALYYMLSGSIELRHAPFALWINDLSSQDPYYILPILMGVTMFLIQKMSPTAVTAVTADPIQQKIMNFMPVIFTIFFLWFPSGLVLYYTISNILTIIQQHLIYQGLEKRGLHKI